MEILRGDFVKTLGDYELDMSESTFQQDNDPKHVVMNELWPPISANIVLCNMPQ